MFSGHDGRGHLQIGLAGASDCYCSLGGSCYPLGTLGPSVRCGTVNGLPLRVASQTVHLHPLTGDAAVLHSSGLSQSQEQSGIWVLDCAWDMDCVSSTDCRVELGGSSHIHPRAFSICMGPLVIQNPPHVNWNS